MTAFVTHPSIRIKGTENNYTPIQCLDAQCGSKHPHMHCPFCVRADSYQDPVILKAHYRVKHVDKGLDFAGLKVLRCCDHCDIVGAIKGEKKFKGAHWHCYRCRNGFNRRDEALKHYKTHFRNPHTTFQIQVTQEVNTMLMLNHREAEEAPTHITQEDLITIHPALTEAVMSTAHTVNLLSSESENSLANGKSNDGYTQVSVAANETVGTSDTPTIMIIERDEMDDDMQSLDGSAMNTIDGQKGLKHNLLGDPQFALERKIITLHQQNGELLVQKSHLETSLRAEIEQLKLQIEVQAQQIATYQKREQELLSQLSVPLNGRIQDLISRLQAQHTSLLHEQLAELKREYITTSQQISMFTVNAPPEAPPSGDIVNSTDMQRKIDAEAMEENSQFCGDGENTNDTGDEPSGEENETLEDETKVHQPHENALSTLPGFVAKRESEGTEITEPDKKRLRSDS